MAQSNTRPKELNEDSPAAGRLPVEKFHDGPVHVSIWENNGVKGAFRTATFQLRYKDSQDQWQTGHSYGISDIKHLESAATEARSRIETWQQKNQPKETPRPPA